MSTREIVEQTAEQILAAWREVLAPLPLAEQLRPANSAQAYDIQQAVSRKLGAIGGWRICRPGSLVGQACTPLPVAAIRPAPARMIMGGEKLARFEAEVCFRIGRNLPDYDAPYTREQVLAAIESCHPGVAVLHGRFIDSNPADPLIDIVDDRGHRYLVYGPAMPAWPTVSIDCVAVTVLQGGSRVFSYAGTPVDDAVELLRWLANEGARCGGGLTAGQWIAIGLAAGEIRIPTGCPARIVVGSLGSVDVRFS